MKFLTEEKLTIVGAAGMIGSNMAQTAMMMRLTPNICLYDPFAPALEGVAEELFHCGFENVNLTFTSDIAEAFKDAKYIGVSIKTEGSSQPEIIINPRENFDAKFDYYMEAYDDDLILIAAKGKKDIRIVAAGHGNRFEDIENQLIGEKGKGWRELIAGAIDNAYDRLVASKRS